MDIFDIASDIKTPLSLAGLIAAVLFYSIKIILSKNIFPTLTKNFTSKIFTLIINRVFTLSLVATILGVSAFVIIAIFGNPKPPVKPENDLLSLTIYVHVPEGKQDRPLSKGNLTADFWKRDSILYSPIGENGRTTFDKIPIRYKGEEVKIHVEAEGFELLAPYTIYKLNDNPKFIAIAVRKKPPKNTYVIEGPIPGRDLVELTDYLSANGFKYSKEQPFFKIRISYDTALIRARSGLYQAGEKVIRLAINDGCEIDLGFTSRHAFPATKTDLLQRIRKQAADSINLKKDLVLNQIQECL